MSPKLEALSPEIAPPEFPTRDWDRAKDSSTPRAARRRQHPESLDQIQKIENDLKMDVRRPSSIFLDGANASKSLALRPPLAPFQSGQRVSAHMPVQREE